MKILVSACLSGACVRYNGTAANMGFKKIIDVIGKDNFISACPEILGGLSVPRLPSEIVGNGSGYSVILGKAKVIDEDKKDVTGNFILGAEKALTLARKHGIQAAILKEYSPSCGRNFIYDGTFSRKVIEGIGVTSALLERNKISVFSEYQMEEAFLFISQAK